MTTSSYRPLRVAGLLKREIAALIRNRTSDPRLRKLIVTDVEVSKGCAHAKVYIYIPEDPEQSRQEILKAAIGAAGYIRNSLSADLGLRFIPKLSFIADDSYDRAKRITDTLRAEMMRVSS